MTWLTQLFAERSVASAVISIAVAGAAGAALGKVKVRGVGLGVAGVLFAGLAIGHRGLAIDAHVLEFVREFGLILFVYTLGLQIGPGFVGSLRSRGLVLNGFAAAIVLLGTLIAAFLIASGRASTAAGAGLLSGATTNTPSLAAGQQALAQLGADDTAALQGLAYAVAYPFGIVGIILTLLLIRVAFHVDVKAEVVAAEVAATPHGPRPSTRNLEVRNENLAGIPLGKIPGLSAMQVVVSRISRGGKVEVARPETELHVGDILLAVGPDHDLDQLRIIVGAEVSFDLRAVPGPITTRRLIVTQSHVLGKPLAELTTFAQHQVAITRVTRGGLELSPSPAFRLHFGDILMVVGEGQAIVAVASEVGDSPRALEAPQPIPFFVGIALGVLVGSVPIALPGLPAAMRLGLAGGPLVVAILLSRLAHTGPLVWHLPPSSNHMLREVGITMFLAAVGIKSGERFVDVLTGGDGFVWLGYGVLITVLPILCVGLLARLWKKLNYAELCGLLAGSMTDPPALAFAQQTTDSDVPAVAYATVYPLVMLLRVLCAQVLVFLLYQAPAF